MARHSRSCFAVRSGAGFGCVSENCHAHDLLVSDTQNIVVGQARQLPFGLLRRKSARENFRGRDVAGTIGYFKLASGALALQGTQNAAPKRRKDERVFCGRAVGAA